MSKQKQRCVHSKKPNYNAEQQQVASELNKLVDSGDAGAYASLTRLAVAVVSEGHFTRDTCEHCNSNG